MRAQQEQLARLEAERLDLRQRLLLPPDPRAPGPLERDTVPLASPPTGSDNAAQTRELEEVRMV